MDLLIVPVPLFSKKMAVEAYYFRYLRGNDFTLEGNAASQLDGAMNSPLLEILRLVGVEAFAMDKPIFVPISAFMLLGDLQRQCPNPFEKIVFQLNSDIKPTEQYILKIKRLRAHGFHFAMQNALDLNKFSPILAECEYLMLDQRSKSAADTIILPPALWHLKLIATHIDSLMQFDRLTAGKFSMFEGRFYRTPLTKGKTQISSLKVNTVRLLNTVQDEGFEFDEVANIIQRDPALTVSLMKLVNLHYLGSSQKIKTISHAVTMLGQKEVRKWATTAVSQTLGSDKPDEITRLSLIRAKFAENLAPLFELAEYMQSLFLTGLFSVLDIVLEMNMREALNMIHVTDDIRNALVDHNGPFYDIMRLIYSYEAADWKYVSRQLIVNDVSVENISSAYINATLWYKDLIEESAVMELEGESYTNPQSVD